MSTEIVVAIIVAVPPTLAVIASAVLSLRATQRLHVDVNSRLTQLLESTHAEARAQGKLNGAADERSRER